MGQLFIDQVRAIVLQNLSNEKFGVPELASELGLSKSQTLRKVKAATNKSVNQFIRELRLEKAAKLIKKTDDTIAEISYQVGFSSASYFNKTFSKYYGIAPGEYKTQSSSLEELASKTANEKPTASFISKKMLFAAVVIIVVCVLGYIGIHKITSKSTSLANSIAVLPFKDLSPEDTQWFSDGMSDNILHSLAQMQDVSVTSFTSSATYRNSNKQIPEIAKELGVSYILEGSVTLHNNKIKIIAQLIDANDKHVWSKEYNESFDDIIAVQNNVAQEVMQQLKKSLSAEEETILNKYPTNNMEAYHYYLKAANIDRDSVLTKKSMEYRIDMFNRAIALDSSFSMAYAAVGSIYLSLSHRHFETVDIIDCREKSYYYINKALQLDPKNDAAWAVKAFLSFYSDWDQAKIYLDKAIAINPNSVVAHSNSGIYFHKGSNVNLKKSLVEFRVAFQLSPLSGVAAENLLASLIENNQIIEAETHLEKVKFLFSDDVVYLYKNQIIAHKNRDWSSVIPFSKSRMEADPENALHYKRLAMEYNAILNDDKNAIKYAKKAYELDSTQIELYVDLLIEDEKFKDANDLMQSNIYKSVLSKRSQLNQLWSYYYNQENYPKALNVLKDSLYTNHYLRHTFTYAKMGNRKKVDSMNKAHPWGTGRILYWHKNRASIHAALKDRDSMYFYLDRITSFADQILFLNSSKEVNPYRNEERFKAFLRKHYLPVPGE